MPETRRRPHRVGCSGWNYASWRHGVFYPERCPPQRWLAFYARHFDTVELNATFYRLPTVKAVQGWVDQTPPDFALTIKMSRYVTHVKRLRDLPPSLELFYGRLRPLLDSPKLGPMLWQLPPTFRYDPDRLGSTLEHLHDGRRHAFEFRHSSWFRPETYALLRDHRAALVIADRPSVNTFQTHERTTGYTYVRLHGGTRGRNGNYSHSELTEWAGRLDRWAKHGDVFAYFNNDWERYAINNATSLKNLLQRTCSAAEPASARAAG